MENKCKSFSKIKYQYEMLIKLANTYIKLDQK